MYKAVIFDLDGTLLDSLPDILSVLNYTLGKFGLPSVTYERAKTYIGNGARELVRLALGSQKEFMLDEVLSFYKTEYAQSDNALSRLYEGEEHTLIKLKEYGIKIAVLTNKPHDAALKAEEVFFKKFGFDCVQGQVDGQPLKPSPRSVNCVLDKLGVSAADCVFVGDGEADIAAARSVGMDCVSVLWGYRTKAQLIAAGATRTVENFDELEKIISEKTIDI